MKVHCDCFLYFAVFVLTNADIFTYCCYETVFKLFWTVRLNLKNLLLSEICWERLFENRRTRRRHKIQLRLLVSLHTWRISWRFAVVCQFAYWSWHRRSSFAFYTLPLFFYFLAFFAYLENFLERAWFFLLWTFFALFLNSYQLFLEKLQDLFI